MYYCVFLLCHRLVMIFVIVVFSGHIHFLSLNLRYFVKLCYCVFFFAPQSDCDINQCGIYCSIHLFLYVWFVSFCLFV